MARPPIVSHEAATPPATEAWNRADHGARHRYRRGREPAAAERFPLLRFYSTRTLISPPRQEDRLLFVCAGGKPQMKEDHQLATAMLAIAFAAVMLVVGQLYIEKRSDRLPAAQPR
jgi:hypothetical protein